MSNNTSLPKDWREGRRLRGWDLYQQGWKQNDIAKALGVTEGAVSQWITKGKAQGAEGLRHRASPGAPTRLRPEQLAQLPDLLKRGAEAFGFRGQVWTSGRVAQVIKREFGVTYHPTHCGRLLHQIKFSRQKPRERATQRNEQAIQVWREHHSLTVKKSTRGRTHHRLCR